MDRTAHRYKIYSDFMKSLGIVQKDHEGFNNWLIYTWKTTYITLLSTRYI